MKKALITLLTIILCFQCVPVSAGYDGLSIKLLSQQEVSIDVSQETIDFGIMRAGDIKVGSESMVVNNNGTGVVNLNLSLITVTTTWECVEYSTSTPDANKYRLYGMFDNSKPYSYDFAANDVISTVSVAGSASVFANDSDDNEEYNGFGVMPGGERSLYFRFDCPSTHFAATETIHINITVTAAAALATISTATIDRSGGTISLFDGTGITIPAGAIKQDVDCTVEQLDSDNYQGQSGLNGEKPIAVYEFGPDGLTFAKPVDLVFTISDYLLELSSATKDEIGVYWLDGSDWVLLGGELDSVANTISIKTDHLSIYAIFKVQTPDVSGYKPKRTVFTPATVDGNNDFIQFRNLSGDYEINIYDVSGRKITTLTDVPVWRGKDDLGNLVESGVYIYQFEVEVNGSKVLVSGAVTVAK